MATEDHDNLYDRLTDQLKEKYNRSEEDARKMAKDLLMQRGHLTEDGELTEEGEERSLMGAEGRSTDRAINRFGGKESDYFYDPEKNYSYKKKED